MPVEITPITTADLAGAISCIQTAFAQDPYFLWVNDPATFDAARNSASLRAKCLWGIRSSSALFYVAKDPASATPDKVLGVSMWTTPEATASGCIQSWPDWFNDYMLWFAQGFNIVRYRGWGGLRRDRYWIWKREQAKCQTDIFHRQDARFSKQGKEGFYFVNIVTVMPETQGMGVGRKLFEVVMKMADEQGRACYLESSREEPNTTIYRKLGFELVKNMKCLAEDGTDHGCDLFCMVRLPK